MIRGSGSRATLLPWLPFALCLVFFAGCSDDAASGAAAQVDAASDLFGGGAGGPIDLAPILAVSAPTDGTLFAGDATISVTVSVTDDRDDPQQLRITLSSDKDGPLTERAPSATGTATLEVSGLTAGSHTLVARTTDSGGNAGEATVLVLVNGLPDAPLVAIAPEAPGTGDELVATLTAPLVDPNRASSKLTLTWSWTRNGQPTGVTEPTVSAALTKKGETWRVEARAADPFGEGEAGAAEVTIGNTPPRCESALLLPSSGNTDEPFTCSCSERDEPDEGDPVSDRCVFKEGDAVLQDDGTCTLDPAVTEKGSAVTCTLVPSDGEGDGKPPQTVSSTVVNTPPAPAAGVTLSPAEGDVLTAFSCAAKVAPVDIDGDPLTLDFTWSINGFPNPGGTTATVVAGSLVTAEGLPAARGDTVRCALRASDGAGLSEAASSQPVTLGNAAPSGGLVTVTPAEVREGDVVRCQAKNASDPDGDGVQWLYGWLVNGEPVPGVKEPALPSAHFDKGDVVTCAATPSDGIDVGPAVASKNAATVANTLPSLESATVTPAKTNKPGTFTCTAVGFTDPDAADPEEVSFAWFYLTETGAKDPLGVTGPSLEAKGLTPGQRVVCVATPRNGEAEGTPVESAPADVINHAPSLDSVALEPPLPTATSTLLCAPVGFADEDGDEASYSYRWLRNGTPLAATTPTLNGVFQRGDTVRCAVTPGDSYEQGAEVLSGAVVVQNTVPSVASAAVDPAFGPLCGTFNCAAKGVIDPDQADTVLLSYRWERNGAPIVGKTGKQLTGTPLQPGDQIRCAVKPTDGSKGEGGETVFGAEVTSAPAAIVNDPPTLQAAVVTPAVPSVGDVLTCTPVGFADAQCSPPEVTSLQWYADGAPLEGATGETLATAGVAIGTEIACQAVPNDGFVDGPAVLSEAVTLAPVPMVPPVMGIKAPLGADGDVQCQLLVAPKNTDGASIAWMWRINDGPPATKGPSLPASAVAHCDRVQCWMVLERNGESVSSNVAEAILPLGPDCDDGNACTSHACAPAGGCQQVPTTVPCDDGDACTIGDACAGGACKPLGPLPCDDGNGCTSDGCDPAKGCTHASLDGVPCDDGDPCSTGETCVQGACGNGQPKSCDDGLSCTADSCQAGTGACEHAPEHGACSDGVACTVDTCQLGKGCVFTPTPGTCDDGNPCTADSCLTSTGCANVATNEGAPCEDVSPCTTGDVCAAGACVVGEPKSCDDGIACTLDSCDAATGACTHTPDSALCGDGVACTVDVCDPDSGCASEPEHAACDDGSPCTADLCDADEGCQYGASNPGGTCGDDDPCIEGGSCESGYCVGTLLCAIPPLVQILEPLDGAVFDVGDDIAFVGAVSDLADLPWELDVEWTDEVGTVLGTVAAGADGLARVKSYLPLGAHTITLRATNSSGYSALAQVSVEVIVKCPGTYAFADLDGDGHGTFDTYIEACSPPPGWSADFEDCDDDDSHTYVGAPELCDGKDNDCNGVLDDGTYVQLGQPKLLVSAPEADSLPRLSPAGTQVGLVWVRAGVSGKEAMFNRLGTTDALASTVASTVSAATDAAIAWTGSAYRVGTIGSGSLREHRLSALGLTQGSEVLTSAAHHVSVASTGSSTVYVAARDAGAYLGVTASDGSIEVPFAFVGGSTGNVYSGDANPGMALAPGGEILACWTDNLLADSAYGVFTTTGEKVGGGVLENVDAYKHNVECSATWGGSRFGVAWKNNDQNKLSFIQVAQNGTKASNAVVVGFSKAGTGRPAMAANGTSYGIAYSATVGGKAALHLALVLDNGLVHGAPLQLTDGASNATQADVVWHDNAFRIVYRDDKTGAGDLYVTRVVCQDEK